MIDMNVTNYASVFYSYHQRLSADSDDAGNISRPLNRISQLHSLWLQLVVKVQQLVVLYAYKSRKLTADAETFFLSTVKLPVKEKAN